MILGEPYAGPEVDVWSAGVLLYYMLQGRAPFASVAKVIECGFESPTGVSEQCDELLRATFVRERARRIDISGILQHPWVMRDQRRVVATIVEEPERKKTKC
jgi:serine/threonine protein kinase